MYSNVSKSKTSDVVIVNDTISSLYLHRKLWLTNSVISVPVRMRKWMCHHCRSSVCVCVNKRDREKIKWQSYLSYRKCANSSIIIDTITWPPYLLNLQTKIKTLMMHVCILLILMGSEKVTVHGTVNTSGCSAAW